MLYLHGESLEEMASPPWKNIWVCMSAANQDASWKCLFFPPLGALMKASLLFCVRECNTIFEKLWPNQTRFILIILNTCFCVADFNFYLKKTKYDHLSNRKRDRANSRVNICQISGMTVHSGSIYCFSSWSSKHHPSLRANTADTLIAFDNTFILSKRGDDQVISTEAVNVCAKYGLLLLQ